MKTAIDQQETSALRSLFLINLLSSNCLYKPFLCEASPRSLYSHTYKKKT